MKFLGILFIVIIAYLPKIWIADYHDNQAVWWTVMLIGFLGRLLGYIEGLTEG